MTTNRLLVFPFFAAWSLAQVGTASLGGSISDATGAVIPGAKVTLDSTVQKYTRSTVSGSAGEFALPALPPGEYQLQVEAAGFQTDTRIGINLSSGQASTLNVTLAVATATEQVTISEAPPLLQTATATLGTAVPEKHVTELPLLGRSFLSLILLTPGAAPVPPAGATTNYSPVGQSLMPSVYGQRQKDNNFTLDGVENRDPNLLGVPVYPPPEAIAEMKVESGMSSVIYGHASGATVNVVTKSGTNRWHGDLWEFLRNNKLDSRSFFLPTLGAFRWNQFGGSAGGPLEIPKLLSRDRGWYVFGYYEGLRIRRASNFTGFVPTPAELQGNFAGAQPIFDPYTTTVEATGRRQRQPFPGNQIPQRMLNQSMLTIATALYPEPNLPPGQIPGANFLNTTPVAQDADQWSGRVDHQFGPRHSFFSRYSEARNPARSVGLPALPSRNLQRLTNAALSDTITLNPQFLVTARFGLARSESQGGPAIIPGLAARAGTLAAYPAFYNDELIPPVSIPGYTGLSQERSIIGPLWQSQWSADAQRIRGPHTIEFGGNFVRTSIFVDNRTATTQFSPNQTSNFVGQTGQAFASLLLGLPESASRNAGNTLGDLSGNSYSLYFQENWRATRTLTLNAGLRYDFAAPLVIKSGLGTFIWETGEYVWDQKNPITGAPATIRAGGIPPDRNNCAPRAGIAWQLSPKTVIRSAFGIFFNTYGSNYVQTQQSPRGNWPFAFPQALAGLNQAIPNAVMPNPFPGPATGSTTPLGCQQCLNVIKSSSRTSYVEEWTFSVQRQLARQWGFEAAYFGSHGVKLVGQMVDNTALVPGPGPFRERQRWPQFPPYIVNGYNVFPSWYHGASLKLDKRFSQGLSFLLSYTFSKNLNIVDNLSNASLAVRPPRT